MRPSVEDTMMLHAQVTALRSTCGRLSVGAVVVDGDRPIGFGYNGAAKGEDHCTCTIDESCRQAVHAEINALLDAGRGSHSTEGCDLFLTHSPCYTCAGFIINAGINQVFYKNEYRDSAGLMRLASRMIICWQVRTTGTPGIDEWAP